MRKLLLLAVLILPVCAYAQLDTLVFVGGFKISGKLEMIKGDTTQFNSQGLSAIYSTRTITRFAISDNNPNKAALEKAYLDYLDRSKIQLQKATAKIDYTAGYYLKRGAERQLTGIGVGFGGALIGGVMMATMEKPTVGAVVIGVGSLIGGILNISGIADIRKAGIQLDKK